VIPGDDCQNVDPVFPDSANKPADTFDSYLGKVMRQPAGQCPHGRDARSRQPQRIRRSAHGCLSLPGQRSQRLEGGSGVVKRRHWTRLSGYAAHKPVQDCWD